MTRLTLPLLALSVLFGCASGPAAPRVATITHIAFVSLDDPGDYAEALADADRLLGTIPSVASYSAGGHIDTGRASILADYDLGIVLGFASDADLAAYVEHPQHVEYVQTWKPRITSLRVYDIHDPTP